MKQIELIFIVFILLWIHLCKIRNRIMEILSFLFSFIVSIIIVSLPILLLLFLYDLIEAQCWKQSLLI